MSKPESVDKSRQLIVLRREGQSADRATTDLMAEGVVTNANLAVSYLRQEQGSLSLSDMVDSLKANGDAINRGDLSAAERMLTAQASALNAIFAEMARIAQCNLLKVPDVADRYLRLALRAQSQCRATVETLAAMKNPPVVFARQANIAHGPQQVNNGPAANTTPPSASPGETASAPTELLEDCKHGRTQLDTRAAPAASRAHPGLEPVGAVNRPAHR